MPAYTVTFTRPITESTAIEVAADTEADAAAMATEQPHETEIDLWLLDDASAGAVYVSDVLRLS